MIIKPKKDKKKKAETKVDSGNIDTLAKPMKQLDPVIINAGGADPIGSEPKENLESLTELNPVTDELPEEQLPKVKSQNPLKSGSEVNQEINLPQLIKKASANNINLEILMEGNKQIANLDGVVYIQNLASPGMDIELLQVIKAVYKKSDAQKLPAMHMKIEISVNLSKLEFAIDWLITRRERPANL